MSLLSRTRRVDTPVPAPRRPPADRQCTGNAATTGARCTQWSRRGVDTCHAHGEETHRHQALTASVASVQMEGVGWQTWRPGAQAWQNEAWRLYDLTGQLRFVSNWVGNSCSRCRLYVAEVDESGEVVGEAEDPDVAALAAGPLGQGPAKDEQIRVLAINLFVPGDGYVIAEAGADDGTDSEMADRWFVVSNRQIRRSGDLILVRRPLLHGGGEMVFRPGIDLILRVWTPHPADTDEPDSPTRSAIPDLREIEAIKKREFAELDSRLAGAGLLPLPQGIDFPRGDDDPAGLNGFQALLMRTMATSLQDRASAEAMVPILMTVPDEALEKIKQVTFWSELSEQLQPMRESAIRSLAQSLDIPAEILLGLADSNHWTSWQVSEDAVSTQIVPILNRIADALTTGYLNGALEQMGKEPGRYAYAFDTAPLTTRPNRAADALNYHKEGILSDEAAIIAGAFTAEQMPTAEERVRRIVEIAVKANPLLLAEPIIRDILQLPPLPAGIEVAPAVAPPAVGEPAEEPAEEVAEPRSLPQQTPQTEETAAVIAVAGLAVRRALTLASGRLIPHTQRDRYADTPRHELHVRRGPVSPDMADHVLRGAWDDLPCAAEELHLHPDQLQALLHGFAVELLTRGMAYQQQLLRDLVTAAMRGRRLDSRELASV